MGGFSRWAAFQIVGEFSEERAVQVGEGEHF
jgi:hypothetical protein